MRVMAVVVMGDCAVVWWTTSCQVVDYLEVEAGFWGNEKVGGEL